MRAFSLTFSLFAFVFVNAQFPGGRDMKALKDIRGRVYGRIIDAKTKKPVEYATVLVLWYNKDSLIGGSLTKENGEFNVENLPPMGGFRFRVTQVGYKNYETKIYMQIPDKLEQDLGDIKFEADEKLLSEVEVTAEKQQVVMNIDKRTYNVEKDLSVRGGTAVDVMKNVPGVTVDVDGNAQLRNQSPTIFIDGRPTTLTLPQIPADQIDRVEIITNPSVKFDASSTGGILNIIMKKNLKPGYNGMANAYAGTGDRYGGMLNLNLKEGKWNVTALYSYNQSTNLNNGYTRRTQLDSLKEASGYFNQDNLARQRNMFNFGRLAIEYRLNNRNSLTLNGNAVGGQFKTSDKQTFQILDRNQVMRIDGTRINDQHVWFENYTGQLIYKKTFPRAGKELTADVNYNHNTSRNGYLFSTYSQWNPDTLNIPATYQKSDGSNFADQYVFQLDYTNPVTDTKKFEAGVKSYYKNTVNVNNTYSSTSVSDIMTRDDTMSNHYVIDEMVNAAYVNYSSSLFGISYQAGLRLEQSYYRGAITDKNRSFSYLYPSSAEDIMKSVFPGLYLSKKFSGNQEWQLNFSRKIQRPNFFQLMPFVMFADRQNYRIGNPKLKPEFRNIAELNYNKIYSKGSYLGSLFTRYEEQPITDVAYPSPTDPSVLVNTTVNGTNSFRYGMEHTLRHTLVKNLDLNLNGTITYIYIRGLIVPTQPEVTAKGYFFSGKASLIYKFPKQLTVQVNGNYESPRVLLLGATTPVYFMDVSLNKMFGTKWTVTLLLSDAFNTKRTGTHYETPFYIQDLSRRRETRFVRLTVAYLFGKMDASIFKRKQQRNQNDAQGNQDGLDFGR
jgi:hypothetical protein